MGHLSPFFNYPKSENINPQAAENKPKKLDAVMVFCSPLLFGLPTKSVSILNTLNQNLATKKDTNAHNNANQRLGHSNVSLTLVKKIADKKDKAPATNILNIK